MTPLEAAMREPGPGGMPRWYWAAPQPGTVEFQFLTTQAKLTDALLTFHRRIDALPRRRDRAMVRHILRYPWLAPLFAGIALHLERQR